jgi:hypothetical protein
MYRIDVQEPPILDWRPLVSDVTDTSYRVTGLRPTRDYSFRIVPYSGTDYWEPLPPVMLTDWEGRFWELEMVRYTYTQESKFISC